MEIRFENIIFAAAMWVCAFCIGGIALWIAGRNKPVCFWRGRAMRSQEITDIRAYNRANAVMYCRFSLCFVTAGIIAPFNLIAGVIFIVTASVLGSFAMTICYNGIYERYQRTGRLSTRK